MLSLNYRKYFQEAVLNLIWSQWTSLGVPGSSIPYSKAVIDPEALILFTCVLGRNDPRIFDEMMNWINKYQKSLNAGRFKRMLLQRKLEGGSVFCAVLEALSLREPKWKSILGKPICGVSEPLFHYGNPKAGRDDPGFSSRGYSRSPVIITQGIYNFNPISPANLIMTLRAVFGVNSRSEVLTYLLTHAEANSRRIALDTYYLPKTIYNALSDMEMSGRLRKRIQGKASLYSLKNTFWKQEFLQEEVDVMWLDWPLIFSTLERILRVLLKLEPMEFDSIDKPAEVILLLSGIEDDLNAAFPLFMLNNDLNLYPDETALPEFSSFLNKLLIYMS
ncbi:MAG: hypothetical protein KAR40_15995 [Candidatus Sabulitectum sp.]|nr:hypothetical protein [Candidatus Sabulitectum sp.]